jgi:hypothetical protein
MRNSYQDGRWLFEEIGISIHGGVTGNFSGAVDVEDGEISTVWLEVSRDSDPEPVLCAIAPGSFLHTTILPQISRDLPAMIDWQSGGRANLTAASRAQSRALVTP